MLTAAQLRRRLTVAALAVAAAATAAAFDYNPAAVLWAAAGVTMGIAAIAVMSPTANSTDDPAGYAAVAYAPPGAARAQDPAWAALDIEQHHDIRMVIHRHRSRLGGMVGAAMGLAGACLCMRLFDQPMPTLGTAGVAAMWALLVHGSVLLHVPDIADPGWAPGSMRLRRVTAGDAVHLRPAGAGPLRALIARLAATVPSRRTLCGNPTREAGLCVDCVAAVVARGPRQATIDDARVRADDLAAVVAAAAA